MSIHGLCHNAGMAKNIDWRMSYFPVLHGDALLLALTDDHDWPSAKTLTLDGTLLQRKTELHVTLLGRDLTAVVRARLEQAHIHAIATRFEWHLRRTGAGCVLRKTKHEGAAPLPCTSLIERVELPAFSGFRQALAEAAQVAIPEALPHVTLYTAGDPAGIGVPDLDALAAMRQFDLRLPLDTAPPPPALPPRLQAVYADAEYRIPSLFACLRISHTCATLDAELARRSAHRAIVITACNPYSTTLAPAANALRQQWLQHELARAGIATLPAEGHDPTGRWPTEPGLLAFDTSPAFDDILLRRFEQHALVAITRGQPAHLLLHPGHR